jgi:hypothetical protein
VGNKLLRVWMVYLATPWLAAMALWVASIVDAGDKVPTNAARWTACAAFVLLGLSVARSVYLFLSLASIELDEQIPTVPVGVRSIGRANKAPRRTS